VAEHGDGVKIKAPVTGQFADILTAEAIKFVVGLHRSFNPRRKELLAARLERQKRIDVGERPDFLPETKKIRESEWTVAPLPIDLLDRRVEITGSVDREVIIDALNSGAKVFTADFGDSTAPTWENLIQGQVNLRDATCRTIFLEDEDSGESYELKEGTAALLVCPRGWHMEERHVLVDGEPISASIFDFGLYFFHNAKELLSRDTGPYIYLPKIENHLEARLWNDIFIRSQQYLAVPTGSIKATVLIETILASFEMDEILWELREHSAGLSCVRWHYIFSFIKTFAGDKSLVIPDRAQVTMAAHFMRSYSRLCIKTCHRRGVSAIGRMSALIPVKSDLKATGEVLASVRADKEREATEGFDGTCVAHPDLVPVAMEVFNCVMPTHNQIDKPLSCVNVTAADLLQTPVGGITEAGMRQNVEIGLGYVEAWLRGSGCVPLFNLMEDSATAEISHAQLWQWIHHSAELEDGRQVTLLLVEAAIKDELTRVKEIVGMEQYRAYRRAAELMQNIVSAEKFTDFLILAAYPRALEREHYPA
jgi:malate synthase